MKYSIRKKWNEMRGFVFFTLAITLLWGMEFAFADFYDRMLSALLPEFPTSTTHHATA